MGKKIRPIYMFSKRDYSLTDIYRLKVRGQEKVFHAHGNCKKAGVVIFI